MENTKHPERDRILLEEIERDPDTTQASMADRLGVAVGTVNWHIKRLVAKGYVKVKRAERRKLRYIITPEGLALRARLTVAYVENSMQLYRAARSQARSVINAARKQGFRALAIDGEGDIADVARLTCLEQGIEVVPSADGHAAAVVEVRGQRIRLREGTGTAAASDDAAAEADGKSGARVGGEPEIARQEPLAEKADKEQIQS